MIRRSFSAFPDGCPGYGLLLLRVSLGARLLYWAAADLIAARSSPIPSLIAALAGVFVMSGLYTPAAGAIIVLAQLWIVLSPTFAGSVPVSTRLFLAAMSASLAMLGPGAWSLDARRFGRKVFEIGDLRRPPRT